MTYSEPVNAQERLHLDLDDSHVHMHVGGVFLFEPGPLATRHGGEKNGVDIDRIRDFVEARLYRVPRYRQRLVSTQIPGELAWVDDASFNIQYHVRHTHLPQPGDERQMKRLCGRLASQRLDREKPLWELYVVEGLEEGRFALVIKVHQCITNGLWEIGLLEALLAETPEDEFEPAPVWLPRPVPSAQELLQAVARRRLEAPLHLGRALLRAARDPERAWSDVKTGLEGFREVTPASETPFNRPVGPHRRFDWLVTDAGEARELAREYRTSLEAVVLSTVAGAVGRFFQQRGIPIPDQRDFTFRAALPERPGGLCDEEKSGDALAWLVAGLPIAEPDPLVRLREVSETLESGAHVGYGMFRTASEWLWPGLYAALARRQLAARASNLTFALLGGPESERFLLGARLLEAFPLLPLVPDQALRLAAYAYRGSLHWGFSSDWDLLPDLHDLVQFSEDCFRELCAAAAAQAA
jgi:diacylglycerol O-acyltransferase